MNNTTPVKFTRYSSSNTLTKKLFLVEDRSKPMEPPTEAWHHGDHYPTILGKRAAAMMFDGEYETVEVANLEEFDEYLDSLETTQAVGYGVGPADRGKICTKSKEGINDAIARSRVNFKLADSAGIFMIDIDPRNDNDSLSPEGAHAALIKAMPELKDVQMLCRASASSNIYHQLSNEQLRGPGGWHLYLVLDDAAEIPRIGETLGKRLWLDGMGYILISGYGSQLVRCLIDTCVFQGERMDFAAGPECIEPVERRAIAAEFFGTQPMLSAEDVVPLTKSEELRYATMVSTEKMSKKTEAGAARRAWLETRAAEALPTGHTARQKADYIAGLKEMLKDIENGVMLPSNFVLYLEKGKPITLKELHADPDKYEGFMICDPLEPEYRGWDLNTRVNLKRDAPELCSWSHGIKTVFTFAESDEEIYARLAALTDAEYDRVEQDEAKAMGVKIGTLRKNVEAQRREHAEDVAVENIVEILEPWDDPVDGADLLNTMTQLIKDHTVLPAGAAVAIALWLLSSYCIGAWQLFPKLLINSPDKRCGKTTLMEILEVLAFRSLMASNISSSAVFRCIALYGPTLFLDEADTFMKGNDEMNGIINAGHKKRAAFTIRTETINKQHKPVKFSVWGAQVIAGIGEQRGTLHDRSICIEMKRKLPHEKVKKLPFNAYEQGVDFRRKCIRWADDQRTALIGSRVVVPPCGNDRTQDNWWPLFAVAEAVGGMWLTEAKSAYTTITAASEDAPASLGEDLLTDIRTIFKGKVKMHSADLVDALVAKPDRPWRDLGRGVALNQNKMASLLKPFKCRPVDVKIGGVNNRGYRLDSFKDAFERYLK